MGCFAVPASKDALGKERQTGRQNMGRGRDLVAPWRPLANQRARGWSGRNVFCFYRLFYERSDEAFVDACQRWADRQVHICPPLANRGRQAFCFPYPKRRCPAHFLQRGGAVGRAGPRARSSAGVRPTAPQQGALRSSAKRNSALEACGTFDHEAQVHLRHIRSGGASDAN